MKDDAELLRELPELELPAELDELVFARACEELDRETPMPVPLPLPHPEMLIYVAGFAAYFLRGVQTAAQLLMRSIPW